MACFGLGFWDALGLSFRNFGFRRTMKVTTITKGLSHTRSKFSVQSGYLEHVLI